MGLAHFLLPLIFSFLSLTFYIIVRGKAVHCLGELMDVNKRPDNNQTADYVPKPKIRGREFVTRPAAHQLGADTCGNFMHPYNGADSEGQGRNNEAEQTIMHCLFAVIAGCNHVDVTGDGRKINQWINAESNDGENNEFKQSSVGFELPHRRGVKRRYCRCVCHLTLHNKNPPVFYVGFFRCALHCGKHNNVIVAKGRFNVNKKTRLEFYYERKLFL